MCADLDACAVSYALVGGLAVSVRCEPRFTRDLDLAVAVTGDEEAERVVATLLGRGYELVAQVEQEATRRLATVRLLPPRSRPPEGVVIDLLFASSGLEPELVAAADRIEILTGLQVPVAGRAHLIALKVLASNAITRPQDRIDAVNLLREASETEIAEARAALDLITSRGYQRDKDLIHEWEELLALRG